MSSTFLVLKFEVWVWSVVFKKSILQRQIDDLPKNGKLESMVFNLKMYEMYNMFEFEVYKSSSNFLVLNIEMWGWSFAFRKSLLQRQLAFGSKVEKSMAFNLELDERYYTFEFVMYNLSSEFLVLKCEIWVWNSAFRKSLLQRHIDSGT